MMWGKTKHKVHPMDSFQASLTLIALGFLLLTNACQSPSSGEVTTSLVHIEASAQDQASGNTRPMPAITFIDTLLDLGIIAEGNAHEMTFPFYNTGKAPLVLADVSTSCGCTVANDWPKTAIAPGQGSEITVRFDSQGRPGENRKEIFVVSNATPSTTTLVMTADVIGPSR